MKREVIVIGGGLAGAATAALLAGKGRDVLVLEKETSASHKVCGEFISWDAVSYLEQLGIDLPALGAQPVENLNLVFGGQVIQTALPHRAWSLSRLVLDRAVLAAAQANGATVSYGSAVTALTRNNDEWEVKTAAGIFHSPTVFLASGKTDLRGWQRPPRLKSDLIGLKMHYRLSDGQLDDLRGRVEMYLFEGCYAGLETVENNTANLCLLVRKHKYRDCNNDWPTLLQMLLTHSVRLEQRLHGASSAWDKPLAVSGMPYGYIHENKNDGEGLYRLGDQMAVISSFAGDGMAMALHSAFKSTACYLRGGSEGEYHAQVREDFRKSVKIANVLTNFALMESGRSILHIITAICPISICWAANAVRFKGLLHD